MSVGSIASTITTAANGLSNLIFVIPQKTVGYQPQGLSGASGFISSLAGTQSPTLVFHYEGEQTVVLESDVTDHYIEDNTAVQDQVALKPEKITTHGFIGELNDIAPNPAFAALQAAANKLVTLSPYTPQLSITALNAYNQAVFLYNTGKALATFGVSVYSSLTGSAGEAVINGNGIVNTPDLQTKQQIMFGQLYGYWRQRTLFTVQTPWAVFQNMVIETMRAIQDAETRVISEFEITFKLLRFASTVSGLPTSQNSQQILANQAASGVNTSTNLTPGPSFSPSFTPGQ